MDAEPSQILKGEIRNIGGEEFKILPTFQNLFQRDETTINLLQDSMDKRGYDEKYPLLLADGLWTDIPILIDGHTRLQIAEELKLIPSFNTWTCISEFAALDRVVMEQTCRRNLTPKDLRSYIHAHENLCRIHTIRGEDGKFIKSDEKRKGRLSARLSRLFGISRQIVEDELIVAFYGNETIREEINNGERSLKTAADEIRSRRKKEKEKQTPVKPLLRRSANKDDMAYFEWNLFPEGQFKEAMLAAPDRAPKSDEFKVIRVAPGTDLFQKTVNKDVVKSVIDACNKHEKNLFLFETSHIEGIEKYSMPKNSAIGIKVADTKTTQKALDALKDVSAKKILQFNGISEDIDVQSFKGIDLVSFEVSTDNIDSTYLQKLERIVKLSSQAKAENVGIRWIGQVAQPKDSII